MEQQEAQRMRDEGRDGPTSGTSEHSRQTAKRRLRATIQAIDTRSRRSSLWLRKPRSWRWSLRAAACRWPSMPPSGSATWASGAFPSAVHEKNLAFATLTPKTSSSCSRPPGRAPGWKRCAAAKGRDVPVLVITCDSHGPLAQLADYVMTASNREQRLIEGSHAASLLLAERP